MIKFLSMQPNIPVRAVIILLRGVLFVPRAKRSARPSLLVWAAVSQPGELLLRPLVCAAVPNLGVYRGPRAARDSMACLASSVALSVGEQEVRL